MRMFREEPVGGSLSEHSERSGLIVDAECSGGLGFHRFGAIGTLGKSFGNGQEALVSFKPDDVRGIDCFENFAGAVSKTRDAVSDSAVLLDFA